LGNTILEKKIDCFVCLHHAITGKEKKKVLLDSDLFIQTSRHEGMPMGILEAMSYGVPCLITEGTSLGDIVREYNAGWVAETNQESIILTLKRVLEEKDLLNNKSAQARKLVMENYSWAKTSKSAVLEYESLINHKRSEI
ncbi:MAG: glycosyltransferase family 4 protein, partial [Butyrivibrio sp.]|nr:glycosyltransferase family 4 protein [Butyrivibrio sp.]